MMGGFDVLCAALSAVGAESASFLVMRRDQINELYVLVEENLITLGFTPGDCCLDVAVKVVKREVYRCRRKAIVVAKEGWK